MAKQNLGGVYANMDFPPYVWTEYPKHIKTGNGSEFSIANNAEEEAKILAKLQKNEDDAPPETYNYVADPEKEILISRAAELGVPINRKWSKSKIQTVVQGAEDNVDALPAELPEVEEVIPEENSEQYKDKLIAEAKDLGIPANKLWGIPRLKSSIAEIKKSRKNIEE
jgi:hypothetical protein